MKDMRVLGKTIEKLAAERHVAAGDLGELIHCSAGQVALLFKGRLFLAFDQLSAIADRFQVSVDELLDGDMDYYNKTVVECMGEFSNDMNREEILDIIDDYLDLRSAVAKTE